VIYVRVGDTLEEVLVSILGRIVVFLSVVKLRFSYNRGLEYMFLLSLRQLQEGWVPEREKNPKGLL